MCGRKGQTEHRCLERQDRKINKGTLVLTGERMLAMTETSQTLIGHGKVFDD